MECFDNSTNVSYRDHEEWVISGGTCLGFCARCGEITDLAQVKRLARLGNERCQRKLHDAGYDYLSDAERRADAALSALAPEQRATLLARQK